MDNLIVTQTAVESNSNSLSEQVGLTQSQVHLVMERVAVAERAMESATTSPQFTLVTYDETFARWLENKDHSERTIRLYKTGLVDFRTWFERVRGKDLEPALITPLDVRAYRRYLQEERQVKPRTTNSYLAAVRAFCRWAMDAGLAAGDPSSGIKGIEIVEESPKWLTRLEQYKVLNAAQERVQLAELKFNDKASPGVLRARRDQAIVVLMLNTGLRLSEVAWLKIRDLVIRPRSGSVAVTAGKGNKARVVRLNIDVRMALSAWIEVRGGEESDPLFTSQKGGEALTARAIARRVEYIGTCANVNIHPHMLRHSFAKNMVDEGVALTIVGKELGHKSLDTTRHYTMPSDEDEQAAVERVAWRD
jgi:integrase/recombinase XerC